VHGDVFMNSTITASPFHFNNVSIFQDEIYIMLRNVLLSVKRRSLSCIRKAKEDSGSTCAFWWHVNFLSPADCLFVMIPDIATVPCNQLLLFCSLSRHSKTEWRNYLKIISLQCPNLDQNMNKIDKRISVAVLHQQFQKD
jgi:hypothetical protein